MNGLIKASQAQDIRGFGTVTTAPVEVPPSVAREDALMEELTQTRATLANLEASLPDRLAAARAEGVEDGIRQSRRDDQARIDLLRSTAERATEDWQKRLTDIEGLAVALAREILERVFGAEGLEPAAVAAAIRNRIGALNERAVIRLRVGASDITPDMIGHEAGAIGQWDMVVDSTLGEGEAVIDLDLGSIEVGPAQQWPRIASWLSRLEAGEA